MKTDQNSYDLHVLVCTNEKSKGESCGPKGGQALLDHLKSWLKSSEQKGKVRINKSGCLGRCESGIACVAYPKGEWIIEATPEDAVAIQEWIAQLTQK